MRKQGAARETREAPGELVTGVNLYPDEAGRVVGMSDAFGKFGRHGLARNRGGLVDMVVADVG